MHILILSKMIERNAVICSYISKSIFHNLTSLLCKVIGIYQITLTDQYSTKRTTTHYIVFVHLSICPFVHLSICPFVHLFICPFVHLFICSFVHLFICPFVHLIIKCRWWRTCFITNILIISLIWRVVIEIVMLRKVVLFSFSFSCFSWRQHIIRYEFYGETKWCSSSFICIFTYKLIIIGIFKDSVEYGNY